MWENLAMEDELGKTASTLGSRMRIYEL